MATVEREVSGREQWDGTNYASKENLLRIIRQEAEGFFALIAVPEHWESPTASGDWEVRDIVGHLVDTTEGYLERFEAARSGGSTASLAELTRMASTADERARAFRGVEREELLARLRRDFNQVMEVFEGLSPQDWGGLTVTHGYMGPLPAFFYPVFQVMDYGVHSWDIREGLNMAHYFGADAADFLVPFMFILWQATADVSRIGDGPIHVGVRVSGRNAGTWRVTSSTEGMAYEQGEVGDLPAVLDFDPASLVLTAFGRTRAGTAYGDREVARRFAGIFFRI
jgi:uncharacterized protein (TIGR03083 family)